MIRFGRICNLKEDFVSRAKFIYTKLVDRGFANDQLNKTFIKFCAKFPEIPQKYGITNFKRFNDEIIN